MQVWVYAINTNYLGGVLIDDTRSTQPQVFVSIGLSWFQLLQKRHLRAMIFLWTLVCFRLHIKLEQYLAIPRLSGVGVKIVPAVPGGLTNTKSSLLAAELSAVIEQNLELPDLHLVSSRVRHVANGECSEKSEMPPILRSVPRFQCGQEFYFVVAYSTVHME